MSDENNGFILFREYEEDFLALTNEQAGIVIKAIFAVENDHEPPEMDAECAMLFRSIKRQLVRTDTAYKDKCVNNAKAANIRWERERAKKASMQTHANASNAMQADASASDAYASNANAQNAMPPKSNPNPNPNPKSKSNPKEEKEITKKEDADEIIERWNTLPDPIPKISKLGSGSKRKEMFDKRMRDYGKDTILDAIEKVRQSDFLCGKTSNWRITFDWFIAPNNFIKVIEGNYNNNGRDATKTISPRDYLLNLISGGENDQTGNGTDSVYDSHIVSEQLSPS